MYGMLNVKNDGTDESIIICSLPFELSPRCKKKFDQCIRRVSSAVARVRWRHNDEVVLELKRSAASSEERTAIRQWIERVFDKMYQMNA